MEQNKKEIIFEEMGYERGLANGLRKFALYLEQQAELKYNELNLQIKPKTKPTGYDVKNKVRRKLTDKEIKQDSQSD